MKLILHRDDKHGLVLTDEEGIMLPEQFKVTVESDVDSVNVVKVEMFMIDDKDHGIRWSQPTDPKPKPRRP